MIWILIIIIIFLTSSLIGMWFKRSDLEMENEILNEQLRRIKGEYPDFFER